MIPPGSATLCLLLLLTTAAAPSNAARVRPRKIRPASASGVESASAAVPLNISGWSGQKVMLIAAHPDDIEGCAGAAVYLMTEHNVQVTYVIVTNGDKGCGTDICANMTNEQLAVARQGESYAAAAVLGVPASNVVLLDYEDAMVTSYPEVEIRKDLVAVIRRYQPDIVFTWYPIPVLGLIPSLGWDDLGYHPDHQAVGKLALDAQYLAGDPLLFPQIGTWYPGPSQFYMFEFVQPTHFVDLSSDSLLDIKVQANVQHKTQYPDDAGLRSWLAYLGQMVAANTPGFHGTRAEGFRAYF